MIADIFITLCAYAQQGYAFGCVGLCMCARMWPKTGCLGSYRLKNLLLVQFTACFLGLTAKKEAYYIRQLVTPVCVYAAGLCVQLFHCVYAYIYIYIFIYVCQQKNRLFSALNLLLSVICCLLFKFKRLQCG